MLKHESIRQIIFVTLIIDAYGKPDCVNREDLSGILRSLGRFTDRSLFLPRVLFADRKVAMRVPEDTRHDQVSKDKAVTLSIQCDLFDKLMR